MKHSAILPVTAAAVAHGGHGTVIKSLAAGVPVLCIPLGRDQKENATRAVACGGGLTLAPTASTTAIARAVRRLLDEPGFRAAARDLARIIGQERESDGAVVELESLAGVGVVAATFALPASSRAETTVSLADMAAPQGGPMGQVTPIASDRSAGAGPIVGRVMWSSMSKWVNPNF